MSVKKINDRELNAVSNARKYIAAGNLGNMSTATIIKEGRGSRIWDLSGNEYIDYLIGSGPLLIGHAHPEVVSAVTEQVKSGTTFFALNELAIDLAKEIVDAVPCADKVRYTSSGTEATLYAMRVARAFRRKDKILKFEGGFHGMNDYSLMSMSPTELYDFPTPLPDSAGIPKSVSGDVLIAPFNDIETTSAIVEKYHDELGGVIVEPMQRLIPPKPGFLKSLSEITKHYGIPLIFDEMVTGFRLAYGGAQEFYQVTPDLCTLGKVVAGGFPLAVVAGREDIMNHFDNSKVQKNAHLLQIGTLSGNPIAAVAGLATLKVLKQQGAYEKLFESGNRIKHNLKRLLSEAEIPAKVVGEAPVFDVFFTEEPVTDYRSSLKADKNKLARFNQRLREKGIFRGDTKFYVSTAHTSEDINLTISAFESAIAEI